MQHAMDVGLDIAGELRIDFVQYVGAIIQRPHLPHGFVADTGDDAADVVHHRVGGAALVVPVLLGAGQLVADGVALTIRFVGHDVARRRLVRHIVDTGANIDEWFEHRMARHVFDALAINVDLPSIADGVTGTRCRCGSSRSWCFN